MVFKVERMQWDVFLLRKTTFIGSLKAGGGKIENMDRELKLIGLILCGKLFREHVEQLLLDCKTCIYII